MQMQSKELFKYKEKLEQRHDRKYNKVIIKYGKTKVQITGNVVAVFNLYDFESSK